MRVNNHSTRPCAKNAVSILNFCQMMNCFAHCNPPQKARVVFFIIDQLFYFTNYKRIFTKNIKTVVIHCQCQETAQQHDKKCIFKMGLEPSTFYTYNFNYTIIFRRYRRVETDFLRFISIYIHLKGYRW